MTAAQRLRLVLALGAINLVLASVAFAVGIVGVQSPPTTAGGPTPGIAFVSPAPTAADDRPRADSRVIARARDIDARHARPDDHAGRRADADGAGCIPGRGAVADRRADAGAGPHAAGRGSGCRRPRPSARRGQPDARRRHRWPSRPTRLRPSKHPAKPPKAKHHDKKPHKPHTDASRTQTSRSTASRRQSTSRTADTSPGADCASVAARARLPSPG